MKQPNPDDQKARNSIIELSDNERQRNSSCKPHQSSFSKFGTHQKTKTIMRAEKTSKPAIYFEESRRLRKIVTKRKDRYRYNDFKVVQYLVEWTDGTRSWQKLKNIKQYYHLVADFEQRREHSREMQRILHNHESRFSYKERDNDKNITDGAQKNHYTSYGCRKYYNACQSQNRKNRNRYNNHNRYEAQIRPNQRKPPQNDSEKKWHRNQGMNKQTSKLALFPNKEVLIKSLIMERQLKKGKDKDQEDNLMTEKFIIPVLQLQQQPEIQKGRCDAGNQPPNDQGEKNKKNANAQNGEKQVVIILREKSYKSASSQSSKRCNFIRNFEDLKPHSQDQSSEQMSRIDVDKVIYYDYENKNQQLIDMSENELNLRNLQDYQTVSNNNEENIRRIQDNSVETKISEETRKIFENFSAIKMIKNSQSTGKEKKNNDKGRIRKKRRQNSKNKNDSQIGQENHKQIQNKKNKSINKLLPQIIDVQDNEAIEHPNIEVDKIAKIHMQRLNPETKQDEVLVSWENEAYEKKWVSKDKIKKLWPLALITFYQQQSQKLYQESIKRAQKQT